jgi:hypothetical protein
LASLQSRASERQRCYLRARFVFNNGYSSLDAILRNISRTGAKAADADMRDVPENFELQIAGVRDASRRRRARRVWRAGGAMGIAFIA